MTAQLRGLCVCAPHALTAAHLAALRIPWSAVKGSISMDELRRIFGGRCQRCNTKRSRLARGRTAPLQFAHIKPTGLSGRGRGLRHRYFDIVRNPDCYALLCNRCHFVIDAGSGGLAAAAGARLAEESGGLAAIARARLAEIAAGDDAVPF